MQQKQEVKFDPHRFIPFGVAWLRIDPLNSVLPFSLNTTLPGLNDKFGFSALPISGDNVGDFLQPAVTLSNNAEFQPGN